MHLYCGLHGVDGSIVYGDMLYVYVIYLPAYTHGVGGGWGPGRIPKLG